MAKLSTDGQRFVEWLADRAVGAANAKTAKAIRVELGFNDRQLRALAQEAAEAHVLICGGPAGYYVPISHEEVSDAIRRLRSQAFEMLSRAARLERLAGILFPDVEAHDGPVRDVIDPVEAPRSLFDVAGL